MLKLTSKNIPINDLWQEYEIRKDNLPEDLTPDEYDIAIREILDDLGL